ncbi:MAG: formylmethanofuran dehydrogenase subunit E family protein [Methanomassiliicoccales archaeon]|nr:formylmethanofuran dehydrogenase subunit E family protein [Methanomassiliicoccales archaeon]
MVELPGELLALKRFHGHLGPYVVIGYKMGQIGRERIPNRISAVVFTGSKRPLSCTIDGIQFSSSCTLGKNNIVVREENQVKAEFFDEKRLLSVELVEGIRERIDATTTKDNEELVALDLFTASYSELFRITEGESAQSGRVLKLR